MKEFNELDEMFREGLQNAQLTPPPGVWEGISSSVAAGSSATGSSIIILSKWIGTSILAGTIGVAAWYYGTQNTDTVPAKNTAEQVVNKEVPATGNPQILPESATGTKSTEEAETSLNNRAEARDRQSVANGTEWQQSALNDRELENGEKLLAKPQVAREKTPVKRNDQVPQKTAATSAAVNCETGLSVVSEKISNTAYAFTALKPQGMVNWYVNNELFGSGYQMAHEFPDIPGIYQVKAVSTALQAGCRDSFITKVTVAGPKPVLTNFFSPNGDGYNDAYYVEISHTEIFELVITDAANRIVFASKDENARWDGTCRNLQCPEGSYQVTLTYRYPGENKVSVLRQKLMLTRNN